MRTLGGVVLSIREEVAFEPLRQGGGEAIDGGIGLLHSSHHVIPLDARRDDISHRHLLEVHVIVHRRHSEGPLNAEAEGAPETLSHPTAQRSLATRHRVPE